MQAALPLNKPVPHHSFGLVALLVAGIVLVPLPEVAWPGFARAKPSEGEVKDKISLAGVKGKQAEASMGVPKNSSMMGVLEDARAEKVLSYLPGATTNASAKAPEIRQDRQTRAAEKRVIEKASQSNVKTRAELVQHALSWQGVPYAWGGESWSGIDCSAFVQKVFASVGIQLPRTSYEQFREGVGVARSRLLPGDLVFFSTSGTGASHVGIYLGGTEFLSATSRKVEIQSLEKPYWNNAYRGSRRVIE